MESLTLNVRVDANDKKCFEQFCSNVGMNAGSWQCNFCLMKNKCGALSQVKKRSK